MRNIKVSGKSRTVKVLAIALCTAFALGAAAFVSLKLRGDAQVMNDIDKHFGAFNSYAPTPDDYRGIPQEDDSMQSPGTGIRSSGGKGYGRRTQKPRNTDRRIRRSRGSKSSREQHPAQSTTRWEGIRELAPGTYAIDENLINDAKKNPRKFTGGARASKAEQSGKMVGFKINRIGRDNALHAIGLRNGDVITAANGFPLTSPDEVVIAAAALRSSKKFRVDILRNNQKRSLYYRVE
ncbi:MAG: hypothetical protein GY854_27935 [Deltaproteobacteria bacterium]|nr:hypothetical protein [Deltaproteobacteria bacterium]